MGNVHASSPKLNAETLPPSPPIGLNLPPLQTELTKDSNEVPKGVENPGSIEDLHKKCKGNHSVLTSVLLRSQDFSSLRHITSL